MKLLLSRSYDDKQTPGLCLVLDGAQKLFEFVSLELPFLRNEKNVSCIPEGKYNVTKIYSPTKGKCFMVHDVPNRSAILIHKGNYATGSKVDTQGCILVGSRFGDINKDGYKDVVESTNTLTKLLEILPNSFTLVII
jgi:hypothetical protein